MEANKQENQETTPNHHKVPNLEHRSIVLALPALPRIPTPKSAENSVLGKRRKQGNGQQFSSSGDSEDLCSSWVDEFAMELLKDQPESLLKEPQIEMLSNAYYTDKWLGSELLPNKLR